MLTSVELFAGAGGLAMGLTLAGFRHRAVVERDQWACDTIRRNQTRGHELVARWPLHQGDVRDIDFASIREPIDVVAGGPPCQPFSMGGKHRAHDDARDMFPATADAIRCLRPRAFIVENVKGLTRPAFADYFGYILAHLEFPEIVRADGEAWTDHSRRLLRHKVSGRRTGLTYDVSFRLLNAADYGVAQKRERVFIVGFRSDLAVTPNPVGADAPFPIRRIADDPPRHGPHWPFLNPTHSLDALLADQWVSGDYWDRHRIPRAARGACPAASRGRVARLRDRGPTGDRAWRTVRDALAGLPDPEIAPQAARAIADHRFQPGAKFYPGHTGSSLDLPAKTIKAGDHGVPGGENALVRLDGTGRYFTVRESARLQSFPDSYVFGGSWSEVMRQLGNAVPVALAHAVAAAVARTLTPREAGSAARTVALV